MLIGAMNHPANDVQQRSRYKGLCGCPKFWARHSGLDLHRYDASLREPGERQLRLQRREIRVRDAQRYPDGPILLPQIAPAFSVSLFRQ